MRSNSYPILNFFLLVPEILLNLTLDGIYKQLEVFKTLSEENLELNLRQKSFGSNGLIFLMYILVLLKTNPIIKEQSCK